MTRSVTIVNTSNWEHEDVTVTVHPNRADQTPLPPRRLAPGEKHVVGPYNAEEIVQIALTPVQESTPVPFKDAEGNQDWPRVEVHKPKPSEPNDA